MVNERILFDASHYKDRVVRDFTECPKVLTLGRHADLEETTEVYCVDARTNEQIAYFIPKQNLLSRNGPESSIFHLIKVSKIQGTEPTHWLVIYGVSRKGFLLPVSSFDEFGNDKTHFVEEVVD